MSKNSAPQPNSQPVFTRFFLIVTPQLGHVSALLETSLPHSLQFTNAMLPSLIRVDHLAVTHQLKNDIDYPAGDLIAADGEPGGAEMVVDAAAPPVRSVFFV